MAIADPLRGPAVAGEPSGDAALDLVDVGVAGLRPPGLGVGDLGARDREDEPALGAVARDQAGGGRGPQGDPARSMPRWRRAAAPPPWAARARRSRVLRQPGALPRPAPATPARSQARQPAPDQREARDDRRDVERVLRRGADRRRAREPRTRPASSSTAPSASFTQASRTEASRGARVSAASSFDVPSPGMSACTTWR